MAIRDYITLCEVASTMVSVLTYFGISQFSPPPSVVGGPPWGRHHGPWTSSDHRAGRGPAWGSAHGWAGYGPGGPHQRSAPQPMGWATRRRLLVGVMW